MYIPYNGTNAPSNRYGYGYSLNPNRKVRLSGSCCPSKTCNCGGGRDCGCGAGSSRYSANAPGAVMPNIVINVQSGNRKSNDYTDAHNASTSYSPQSSENNPYYFATTEQNPYFNSYKHGGTYSRGYVGTTEPTEPTAPAEQETEVVPMILSPRAAKRKIDFDLGKPPAVSGRRYPLEFP